MRPVSLTILSYRVFIWCFEDTADPHDKLSIPSCVQAEESLIGTPSTVKSIGLLLKP